MTSTIRTHHPEDPEPAVGTVLEIGSPADKITFHRLSSTWTWAHNSDRPRPCSYALVRWWGACRVVAGPRGRPGVQRARAWLAQGAGPRGSNSGLRGGWG